MDQKKVKEKPTDLQIWAGIFIYTLVIGLLIQLVLLPYFFPGLHAGDGLLKGLDSVGFDKEIMENYRAIKSLGWGAWLLKPGGQVVVGIASIFYVLISPHPWAVLPWNAVLNATAGLALYKIMLSFGATRKKTLISILPFVFFPTALLWNSQFHNDCYMIPGVTLFLLGWMRLASRENWSNGKNMVKGTLLIVIGSILIWLVRDYVLTVLSFLSLLVILLILGKMMIELKAKRQSIKSMFPLLLLLTIIAGFIFFLPVLKVSNEENIIFFWTNNINTGKSSYQENQLRNRNQFNWTATAWLPGFVDNKVKSLIITRYLAINNDAFSNIDPEYRFSSTLSVISYLPRALEIGFLAPFPIQWIERGKREASSLMRLAAGAEMLILYFCWIGLVPFFWKNKKSLLFYIISIFCLGIVLVYVIATTNIGSLHRFRFIFLMIFASMGILGWFEIKSFISNAVSTFGKKLVKDH